MPGQRLRRALASVALAVAATTALPAQTADVYREVIGTYLKTGNPALAVKPMLGWDRNALGVAVKSVIATGDATLIEAAAMLHLEIGVAIAGISTPSSQGYLEYGADLIDAIVPANPDVRRHLSPQQIDEIARVRSTWMGVAASAFLSVTDPMRARLFINRASRIAPKSAAILTLRGTVEELEGAPLNPDDWDSLRMKTRVAQERTRSLLNAQRFYDAALEQDPGYPLAQIRRGRVHHLFRNMKLAAEWLEKGSAAAVEPSHQYVAAMFLGAFKQDQKDLAGARLEYERALQASPYSQNAIVALAYIDLIGGRPDQAQSLVRGFLFNPPEDEVWWASKNGMLDHAGLNWLRKRVRP